MKTRVLVLSGEGINCERETAQAFAGLDAEAVIVPIREFLGAPTQLLQYQILALPGGFSFGDEITSGQVLGLALKDALSDIWPRFLAESGLAIGICNGFQILMKMGVFGPLSLVANTSHQFQDRWIGLKVESSNCVWTKGLAGQDFFLPIRHGEGRIWAPTNERAARLEQLKAQGQIVFRYDCDPNGALDRIAGLCDPTGQVLGLMPHPEAALWDALIPDKTQASKAQLHARLFQNALTHVQETQG